MAKLYFRYGAMNSSKTANALMVAYNYAERGQRALLVKPGTDNREGHSPMITSRIGLSLPAVLLEDFNIMTPEELAKYHCVIVDEAQFLNENEVERLTWIVDELKIPVICYGLRTDFLGRLFEGSQALLRLADTIEEIKTVCWCGKKATCNARITTQGKMVTEGPQVLIGGNDRYVAVCRRHYRLQQPNKPE